MAVGDVIINTSLVADNDEILLTGSQQAKILFMSTNPDNTNIKFRWGRQSGNQMGITNTRSSGVKGSSGLEMNWVISSPTANTNINCPLYIDSETVVNLSTDSTVNDNSTFIIYQMTEV